MPLLDNVEIILVDDGSEPPLCDTVGLHNLTIVCTNDKRPWTQPIARNMGAKEAKGEFLIFTDIDHIVTEEIINSSLTYKYDYGRFRRELAILDEEGNITQDSAQLSSYGVPQNRKLKISCHTLSMIVRSKVFNDIGGFREKVGKHPTHDDWSMKRKLKSLEKSGKITKCPDKNPDERSTIYMIPNGRYCGDKNSNPFALFHNLQR